jgi:pyruvate dehydrogenase E1 component
VDYSTGSVGIGATAPIWGALARRYLTSKGADAGTGRQYSLVGDAELDEGAVWEAILDPMVAELGEVVWIVDVNRQSSTASCRTSASPRLQGMFAAAGWQVLTVKYGRLLEELFTRPGGAALRRRIDEMPNPEYQRLLRCTPAQLRDRLPGGDPVLAALVAKLDDATLHAAVRNLGGHDLAALDAALSAIDDTPPTVIFAYTVKGYGLATEGHPQNHSSLLTTEQMARLADELGASVDQPWAAFSDGSDPALLCTAVAERLHRDPPPATPASAIPTDVGRTPSGIATTQAALGRPCWTSPAPPPTPPGASSRCARTSARRPTWPAGSTCGTTYGSRKSRSASTNGSSSATTPTPPPVTRRSASGWSTGSKP